MNSPPAEILSPFIFSVYRITIEAKDPLHFPSYKGSAIRGALGHALRRAACAVRDQECPTCFLFRKCIYAHMFETPPPENDPFLRNKNSVPHPYILRPSQDAREEYAPGGILCFDLILMGRATEYLPYLAYALILMGEQGLGRGRGQCFLRYMDAMGADGSMTRVYHSGDQILQGEGHPISCEELLDKSPPPERCTFRFLTRLELKIKRKYPDVSFGMLFRSLLRRISTLGHLHSGIDCTRLDFSGLSHAADAIQTVSSDMRWEHAKRFSNRQKQKMPFGGLMGKITVEGDLSPFWPFMLLGEWVHVGKKTSFGLGRYELEW